MEIDAFKLELLEIIKEDSMRSAVRGIDAIRACRIVRERSGVSLADALEFVRPLMELVRNQKFPNEVN